MKAGPLLSTYVARVTPAGTGGIAVVEIAGPRARKIVQPHFAPPLPAPGAIAHGMLVDATGRAIDEVLVEAVSADHLAINGHGGEAVSRAIVDLLCRAGAQEKDASEMPASLVHPAALDAVQAEALSALPRVITRRGATMLLAQVRGSLSRALRAAATAADLDRLLAAADAGIRLVQPPRVVLAGRPNAGKSSLANALHRRDRSIVTAVPGTTLDPVEEVAVIDDFPLRIVDTAGRTGLIGDREVSSADLLLYVVDRSQPLEKEEIEEINALRARKPLLVVLNKSDLSDRSFPGDSRCIETSCATGSGIGELRERLVADTFPDLPADAAAAVPFAPRQKDAIMESRATIETNENEARAILQNLLTPKR